MPIYERFEQNSDIAGPRHLNDTVRRQQDTRQRADDFQKRLLANLPPDHPLRREGANPQ